MVGRKGGREGGREETRAKPGNQLVDYIHAVDQLDFIIFRKS